jgi:DNA topoisomerase-1
LVNKPDIEIREYSAEELEARALKKKGAIKNLSSNIRKLRSKVNEDLKSDNEKDFLTALAVYTMLETSERVGNGTSAENGHFGVTGFRKKHVKISDGSVDFKYTGKSGVDHDKKINNSRLANNLSIAIKNSPSDKVFTTSDGFDIKNDRINRYLRVFGVKAKDLRGYSANKWIVSKLKRLTPEETDKKRKTQFNKVVKEVAAKVGHGGATLKKHYMIPELQSNWIDNSKVIDLQDFKIKQGGLMEQGGTVEGSYFNGELSFLNW